MPLGKWGFGLRIHLALHYASQHGFGMNRCGRLREVFRELEVLKALRCRG